MKVKMKNRKQPESLFNDNFQQISENKELKNLFKEYPNYDPYYIATTCIKDRKELIDKLWSIYAPYADYSFAKQYKYKDKFHQRTWEMYLGCTFLENKLYIDNNKGEGPDFFVNNSFYVECTACNNAKDQNSPSYVPPVNFKQNKIICTDVPENQIILRILHAMNSKYKTYKKYLWEKKVNPNLPFILAINSGILGHSHLNGSPPMIIKALFGLEHLQIKFPGGERSYSHWEYVPGDNKYRTDTFTKDSRKEISAIIYSPNTVINMPSDIGSDCVIIPNPYAENPINISNFPFFKKQNDIMPDINQILIF